MKTIILISILLSFASIHTFGQVHSDSLKYHKTGLYKYTGENSDYFIKRTKRKQIEYSADNSQKLVLKVK